MVIGARSVDDVKYTDLCSADLSDRKVNHCLNALLYVWSRLFKNVLINDNAIPEGHYVFSNKVHYINYY